MTTHQNLNAQTVGNVGLCYVCYRLSLLGWNVMPTARNARGIDLLIYSQEGSRKFGIQVKALSQRSAVPLGKTNDHAIADFWVICRRVTSPAPEYFILTPDEIMSLANRNEKDGRVSYWLEPRDYEQEEFKDSWDRVGQGNGIQPQSGLAEG